MNEDDEQRDFIESQMNKTMDVFTTATSGAGRYDQPAGTGIPCRLHRIGVGRAATVSDRTQMQRLRTLVWPISVPGFTMPSRARVLIDGSTWQIIADTIDTVEGPAGGGIARTADLSSVDRVLA